MLLIKIGGGQAINWDYICQDIASLVKKEAVILVHGASFKRNQIAKKLGYPTKTVVSPSGISSIYTDEKALEIFLMVYAGMVNKQVVAQLQKLGVNALGLSGVDGQLWQAKRKANILVQEGKKTKLIKNNLTGKVEKINAALIRSVLKQGYTPVICPPAITYKGEIVNVDNDLVLGVMAKALKIKKIVVLFEAPGLLKDAKDETSLIKKINKNQLDKYYQFAQGRMKKKIIGARIALDSGVKEIYWGDGRIKSPIKTALKGVGTVIS